MSLKDILRLFHPKNIIIELINIYQTFISPYFGNRCRFEPSCSNYAIEAYRKRGFIIGTLKSIWRILRCHPFNRGGYDPVDKSKHL